MNIFQSIKIRKPKRNRFNLGHEVKLSMNMGDLVPIMCEEVVPGDTFANSTEFQLRFAPMLAPIMHRVNVYTHFFFVPNRLIWDEWEEFITGGESGEDSPVFPTIGFSPNGFFDDGFHPGSLADYLGLPVPNSQPPQGTFFRCSALPFRAYHLIYNDYYRDQNLEPPIQFSTSSGEEQDALRVSSLLKLRKRCWEKDYFTSALPWTQRGEDVKIPFEGNIEFDSSGDATKVRSLSGDADLISGNIMSESSNQGSYLLTRNDLGNQYAVQIDNSDSLKVTEGTATINNLRTAMRVQEWLEKNARAGSRYIEQIMAHFGVRSSDARLQRPEYLGGGKSPVMISEVLQTSATDTESPQGNMAGHAYATGNTHEFKKYFEEHGFIIGIMSILPRTSYQQGIRKHFQKYDKFDYFFPEFAHLGEQEIDKSELYIDWSKPFYENNGLFGYTPRYSEYKYIPGRVHGDFRDSLSFWHMGRIFSQAPALNSQFVLSDPTNRIFAVEDPSINKVYVQLYNNLRASRPMPKFGTPSF